VTALLHGPVAARANETSDMLTVGISPCVDAPWIGAHPVRIGSVPAGEGAPNAYVLVAEGERPIARIDLYHHPNHYHLYRAAIAWANQIVIGAGHCVYFVDLDSGRFEKTDLGAYFGSFQVADEHLFVASAERVFCFDPHGSLSWRSAEVGIDGVVIHSIDGAGISGSGEWDPPDGWRSFRLSLSGGVRIDTLS
jgi:hypothetical protein